MCRATATSSCRKSTRWRRRSPSWSGGDARSSMSRSQLRSCTSSDWRPRALSKWTTRGEDAHETPADLRRGAAEVRRRQGRRAMDQPQAPDREPALPLRMRGFDRAVPPSQSMARTLRREVGLPGRSDWWVRMGPTPAAAATTSYATTWWLARQDRSGSSFGVCSGRARPPRWFPNRADRVSVLGSDIYGEVCRQGADASRVLASFWPSNILDANLFKSSGTRVWP